MAAIEDRVTALETALKNIMAMFQNSNELDTKEALSGGDLIVIQDSEDAFKNKMTSYKDLGISQFSKNIVMPPLSDVATQDTEGYIYKIGDFAIMPIGILEYAAIGKWDFSSFANFNFSIIEFDTANKTKTISYKSTASRHSYYWGDGANTPMGSDGLLTTIEHTYNDSTLYLSGFFSLDSSVGLTLINVSSQDVTKMDIVKLIDLIDLDLSGNKITNENIIDKICIDLDANGALSGTLKLEGGTNAAPSPIGQAAITSLQAKGWTVTSN